MKRHFAFPPLDDIDTWKNEYTGKVYQANDGQEASKQKKQISNSKEGIDRRNAFFEGKTKVKQDRSEENQEAERLPSLDSRSSMINNAKSYIGQSFHEGEQETVAKEEKPLSFHRSFQFQRSNKGFADKELNKDSLDSKTASENKVIRYKANEPITKREEKTPITLLMANNTLHEKNEKFDLQNKNNLLQQHDFAAFMNSEKNEVIDLVMDVLNDNRGMEQSELATELVDYAKQLKKYEIQQEQVRKQLLGQLVESSVESIQTKSKEDSLVNDVSVQRIASDVQALMQKSNNIEWKNDPVVQERAGIWALHVAAKRAGLSSNNISSSFKKNSIQAFGRLALHILSTAANQKNQVQFKDDYEQESIKGFTSNVQKLGSHKLIYKGKESLVVEKETGKQGIQKGVSSLKIDAENLLREESTIQDLQLLQNGIQEDKSADEILDAFIETLRNDELDVDAADSRMDIFSGSQLANTTNDVKMKSDSENNRRNNFTTMAPTRSGFTNQITFREDIQQEQSIPKTEVSEKARGFTVKFKDDNQKEHFSSVQKDVYAEENSRESKFIETYM